ncbi:1,4-alpha-glucan branching protein domain-containing protein [Bacillus sp. PS06]|uniref:1,4-alpha-glucan branching protein domain-containing protein n=1 Tax=Bacillus sp. PS06 TaxID=2764176 RepID=UPI001CD857EF|nr:1,4-alpha-glucan branching protein domain-containing protein [Bacillus sp. PS06]
MYTTFILHAHLPYVRNLTGNRLEERWLYEAIAESYIPLIWQLEKDNHQRRWTISFSPTLMEMLSDPLLQQRFIEYIHNTKFLLHTEQMNITDPEELHLIHFYNERYHAIEETFSRYNYNLLEAFIRFEELGKIECITTSASHAILPYISTEEGLHAQILEGIRAFKKHFGKKPKGFWLPECAYSKEVDRALSDAGISYTFVDLHAVLQAEPPSSMGSGAPIISPNGVVLFPRNQELANMVWSATDGYPGNENYREFYRDVGFDRDYEYLMPFLPEGIRVDTGLKYYKITGSEQKEYYRRDLAEDIVSWQGEDFLRKLEGELIEKGKQSYPPYTVVLPFDAELFGHWWFEGPDWFHKVVSTHQNNIEFITGSDFVTRHYSDLQTCHVSFSTWGRDGYGDVWLNEKNHEIYRYAHLMEFEINRCVKQYLNGSMLEKLAIEQMIREWLLYTSSDWAFMIDQGDCRDYAMIRIEEHLSRFISLNDHLTSKTLSKEILLTYKNEYPFLSSINLSNFYTSEEQEKDDTELKVATEKGLKILMLSWEFPPLIIGGLSRHVYDLSRALVRAGNQVTVITTYVEEYPVHEVVEGVEVYRVQGFHHGETDFLEWIGGLNMGFTKKALELEERFDFDIIHAHDWLVATSGTLLKEMIDKTLITTIHATEYGRNNGINTELQHKIHTKEGELARISDAVIVCSEYMAKEVSRLFQLDQNKVYVFPNGVDPHMLEVKDYVMKKSAEYKRNYSHIVFSVGRIVPEKGFQTIIEAAPMILAEYPNVLFLIAGKGPMLHEYRNRVKELGLKRSVIFVGYISDEERNMYFNECDITVFPSLYEPFGIVALEGMIAGKPTIVSDTGGLKEIIIDGITGMKMQPGEKESLARNVLHLLRNEPFAQKLGQNGKYAATTTYSWDQIAKDTCEMFKEKQYKPIHIRG